MSSNNNAISPASVPSDRLRNEALRGRVVHALSVLSTAESHVDAVLTLGPTPAVLDGLHRALVELRAVLEQARALTPKIAPPLPRRPLPVPSNPGRYTGLGPDRPTPLRPPPPEPVWVLDTEGVEIVDLDEADLVPVVPPPLPRKNR
jgi:hypothetical protein